MASHAIPRRRVDAFASISRILEAARRVFASGDGGGPLARIAQEAGVGVATLYRHFPNRETLARAVYQRIFTTEIEPLMARVGASDAPREVLLDVIEQLSEVAQRERGLVSSIGNPTKVATELLQGSSIDLVPTLKRAQEAGNIRSDIDVADIPHLIAMITGALSVVEVDQQTRRRYLHLLLDALNPIQTTPLPTIHPGKASENRT